jgi:hypothetical protein
MGMFRFDREDPGRLSSRCFALGSPDDLLGRLIAEALYNYFFSTDSSSTKLEPPLRVELQLIQLLAVTVIALENCEPNSELALSGYTHSRFVGGEISNTVCFRDDIS